MEDAIEFSRVKTLGNLYYRQAETSYIRFLELDSELADFPANPQDEDYFSREEARSLSEIQTIVFSAMCVEAGAYDYAAVHLGDDFVRQHLDKLDIISKWLVSLRLISGYELPKDSALYNSLRRLVRARNLLVHIKSEKFDGASPMAQQDRLERESLRLNEDAHESFKCLVLMSLTFQDVAPAAAYHLPLRFMEPALDIYPRPNEIKAVIGNCRRILANAT